MRHMARAMALVLGLGVLSLAPAAQADHEYSSFFEGTWLADSGWTDCPQVVTWSVDVRGLKDRVAKREIRRLKEGWQAWTDASGLVFDYVGRDRLEFNPVTNNLQRTDGSVQPDRHVYVAFKSPQQVSLMTGSAVGLGMPSAVLMPERHIITGMMVFRRGYVLEQRQETPERVLRLYRHEMGHVMGLGHAGSLSEIMFSQLDMFATLGPGDRDGAAAMMRPCTPDSTTGVRIMTREWWR